MRKRKNKPRGVPHGYTRALIVQLLAQGLNPRQVAAQLNCCESNVRFHLDRNMRDVPKPGDVIGNNKRGKHHISVVVPKITVGGNAAWKALGD